MADNFNCVADTPKPLGGASSQDHGQQPPCLVQPESMVGACNLGGSAKLTQNDLFYTQQSTADMADNFNCVADTQTINWDLADSLACGTTPCQHHYHHC
jgi:hypothetical protein